MKARRHIFRLLVLLLAGAIINVAVAWGFTLTNPQMYPESDGYPGGEWSVRILDSIGRTVVISSWVNHNALREHPSSGPQIAALLPSWTIFRTDVPSHPMNSAYHYSVVEASGWPYRSVSCECGYNGYVVGGIATPEPHPYALTRDGIVIGLPFSPIFPGFAINTIFYAAIVWALFGLPGAVRRRVRRKRGQCASCAYPLGTSPNCTECGQSLGLPTKGFRS